jgi:OPA family glycerol-3-phosphate transporter-like MFS transporter
VKSRRQRWQGLTIALMVAGYAGYYLCRSNLSVTLPLIIDDLASRGVDPSIARVRLGTIASVGVLAYALTKFVSGRVADAIGGRRNFLMGMAGSIICTFLFALAGGFPAFTVAWALNRSVQALGWAGMVKLTSRWFSYSSYGFTMGVISLSFLFGDAAARQFMSILIAKAFSWQSIFWVCGLTLSALFFVSLILLRESPKEIGEAEGEENPENLFVHGGGGDIFRPLLTSPAFWIVCVLSLGMTIVRETFNLWTPTFFTESLHFTQSEAARNSALFPLSGGVSVVIAGVLGDRLRKRGRALVMLVGMFFTAVTILLLASGTSRPVGVFLVAVAAFLLIGPYSYLAGAISLDFGGKQGSGTASGLIDGTGYLGGVLAGDSVARISGTYGWSRAFVFLAVVSLFSGVLAGVYYFQSGSYGEHCSRGL